MRGINVAEETLIGEINWLRVIGMFVCIIFFIVAIPHIYTYIKKLAFTFFSPTHEPSKTP